MREKIGESFGRTNDLDPEELEEIVALGEDIAPVELSFEEKLALNLAQERLESIKRVKEESKATEKEVQQEQKIADLEARLAALEEKEK